MRKRERPRTKQRETRGPREGKGGCYRPARPTACGSPRAGIESGAGGKGQGVCLPLSGRPDPATDCCLANAFSVCSAVKWLRLIVLSVASQLSCSATKTSVAIAKNSCCEYLVSSGLSIIVLPKQVSSVRTSRLVVM